MSKDKDITLFDDIEWGNKTLPGLTDDELMTKNWNKVLTKNLKAKKSKIMTVMSLERDKKNLEYEYYDIYGNSIYKDIIANKIKMI